MLELKQVGKSFGDHVAVQPTDLVVERGATTVLIGPSGCGKSTLLRLMIGLIWPDDGTIWFNGNQLTPDNALKMRHEMGYIIQDGGLFPHLNAFDNVALLARYLKWDEVRIKERILELAELTRFPTAGLDRFPTQISGGQRQRVSMMRALMLDPPLLLMDEPMGALDPIVRSELQEDLRAIFRSLSKTVVIVTHDLGEAGFFGDTLILMKSGQMVQRGSLREYVDNPADPFVTQFLNAQRSPLDELKGGAA